MEPAVSAICRQVLPLLQDLAADGLVQLEEHAGVDEVRLMVQRIAAGVTSTPLSVATVRR